MICAEQSRKETGRNSWRVLFSLRAHGVSKVLIAKTSGKACLVLSGFDIRLALEGGLNVDTWRNILG